MKNKITIIVTLVFGFLVGIIFTAVFMSVSVDDMMMKELKSPYDFDKTVEVLSQRINTAEGWHVTEVIDQNNEIVENGGTAIGNYKIIKYCHGGFASKMLGSDERKKIGNMMPKSFAVYEKADGKVYISTMNGAVMGKLFGGEIETIIEEVSLQVEGMLRFVNYKSSLWY